MKKQIAQRERNRLAANGVEAEIAFHRGHWVILAGYRPPDWPEPIRLNDLEDVDWLVSESEYHRDMPLVQRRRRKAQTLKSRGFSNGEIAFKMGASASTVKDYLRPGNQMKLGQAA